ncbi:hypothetical protein SAMN02745121_06744 [Nannocystis exedens]|uniref:MYXO-CTERM domain-containing protein n=1 Tax=Nannocystis exedens TaxID=54 RepID=A0A1I2FM38_9BACT|nr:hypothetical protein [Nannocystis exedens]PCC74486.1 M12A family peptidase [Nannocystis exedens]SFF06564.1 hypothetical protein SAMN02745121_06744 [Nannocystis exedens]
MTRSALVLLALLGAAPAVQAAGPVGAVTADCAGVSGWTQDPDAPATPIDIHLYFDGPAGDPVAVGVPLTAGQTLNVGCRGEQCQHGFYGALPLSRLDGQPHSVHAYGIDTNGDPNLELSGSPAVYACPPLPIVAGVKRHIAGPSILDQWHFSTYFDLMKVADLDLAGTPIGTTVDGPPQLALAEGTSAPLWLIDQGFRRLVAPEVVGAWRFDPATAAVMPADAIAGLPEGTPLAARPLLVQGTGPEVWLLDEHQCGAEDPHPACAEPSAPTTGDPTSTGGSPGDDSSDSEGDPTGAGTSAETGIDSGSTGEATTAASTDGSAASSTDDAGASGDEGGCGCRSTAPASAWLLLLALRRRRSGGR